MFKKIFNLFYFHLLFHFIRLICELFPNLHFFNIIRGKLLGVFFGSVGENFSIASGCKFMMSRNIHVGDNVYIAHDCWINGTGQLNIENNVIISPRVIIATTKHHYENGQVHLRKSHNMPIIIKDGAWICGNSTITMGVTIGSGCIVGANTCITKDTIPFSLYGSTPGMFIKRLVKDEEHR